MNVKFKIKSLVQAAAQKRKSNSLNKAECICKQALRILQTQTNNLRKKGRKADLKELYQIIALEYGEILQKQGKIEEAINLYQQVLKVQPDLHQIHNKLGNIFQNQGKLEAAVESYRQALKINPNLILAYYNLGKALRNLGHLEACLESYQQALKIKPDYALAKFGLCMSQLPAIYSSVEEIQLRRNNYQQQLIKLSNYYKTASLEEQANGAEAVGNLKPFYLGYQALNDRELQQIYGSMACQLMASLYPQWSQPIDIPAFAATEKIRIGFVSGFFSRHSIWKIPCSGWVENLDRGEFELFGYHTLSKPDPETRRAAKAFDKFTQGPLPFTQWCEIIKQDKLDILIFTELMMDPVTIALGCLKLAPIQIGCLGHYVTSGLPTIDYFLSSELMEPEDGQEHYTEKLVKLPNLGFHYTPFPVPAKSITKKDIGIKESEIMFWCCQSLFKYLPQHDDIFPRIAKQLNSAKFVFLANSQEWINEVFRQRLSKAFEKFQLDYTYYCIFLPDTWDSSSFAGTTAIADIYLDNIGCSGGNTSIEAIGYNLPVVTHPGKLMRERMTTAFLKMIGTEETIAATKEDYVQIAVHLGKDAQYRQTISQKIADNKHKLYGDLEPIRALEEFLLKAVGKEKKSPTSTITETLRLAIGEHRANHLEQAEQAYHQVLSIQPANADALYGLAMVAQQLGKFSQAKKCLSKGVQVQPNSVKIWFSLGNFSQLQGDFSEAEEAYKKAIALRPDAVSIYNNLGYALQQQSKWKEAINCYQKALQIQPNCVEADVNLGNALYAQGQLSRDRQIHYAQLNSNLGLARKNAGDLQTAEVYYRQAITLQPDIADYHHQLGVVLEEKGNLEQAKTHYQRALELNPDYDTPISA
ncbi:MAG: tetratricopeptide repeat protein [Cyanobacteria bacterium P01_D01_bin.50]